MKNNIQNLLMIYFKMKGWFRSLWLKKDKTYYGGVNNTSGIYMGNNTFYETKNYVDNMYGVVYNDSKPRKYSYLQLGLFKWKKIDKPIIKMSFLSEK